MAIPLVLRREIFSVRCNVFLMIAVAFLGLLFAVPSNASGTYYANADDPAALDTNSCRTADNACLTMNGAIAKILESANPQNSTLLAAGTFAESVTITDASVHGLTISWLNNGTRPVIDATGENYALYIYGVDDVTVDHLDITGAAVAGVYGYGLSGNHTEKMTIRDVIVHDLAPSTGSYGIFVMSVDDVLVKNSVVQNIGSTTVDTYSTIYNYGIYVQSSDDVRLMNNTIRDMVTSNTNSIAIGSVYLQAYGIYVNESDRLTVRNNTIRNISITGSTSAVPIYIYQYGMSIGSTSQATVRDNTLDGIDSSATTTAADQYVYGITTGLQLSAAMNVRLNRNTLTDSTTTVSAPVAETAYGSFTGFGISGLDDISITRNTIKDIAVITASGTGTNSMLGLSVGDVQRAVLHHNTIKNIIANHDGDGSASAVAVRLSDAPDANVYRNRIVDFTANRGTAAANTDNSTGIEVGYNSAADLLNNMIYFTTASTQSGTDGIAVLSSQATPVRIFHNTLHNLLTCLDVDYAGMVKFVNNVCSLGSGGGYGVEVSSDSYNMNQIKSNSNSFYNSAAPMTFNDTDQGTLTYSDWKSGVYLQDKKSITKNPQLNTDNPNAKNYLHIKKGSPLVNKGNATVSFGSDTAMNTLLEQDWDSKARPHGKKPDIGADEL